MSKYASFGTVLKMGNGTLQVETATVVGTITTAGNATFTVTSTGMAGSPLAVTVAVALNDTASMVAAKAITALNAVSAITAMYYVSGTGAFVVLTRKIATADVANLNIAFADDTSDGLTEDASSDPTTAGGGAEVFTAIAQVSNIGGPGLSLDVEDVTTHDSTAAFEEVVATILRSGEVSIDLVYDPANATHAAGVGVLASLKNRILRNFQLIFADSASTVWSFAADVTGFEPSNPHDGSMTASLKLKLTGQPTLA